MDLFGFTDDLTWQDLVLTSGSLIFLVALVPTVLGSSKPAPLTSLSTGSVLIVFAVTYATLGLSFASVTTATTGLTWLLIFWQSVRLPDGPWSSNQSEERGNGNGG